MVLQIKKNSHLPFGCLLSLLIALVLVRYSFSIDIPGILLTAVIMIVAAIGDRDEILAISFCCIPLHEAIDFYIALVVCATFWLLKNYRSIRIGFPIVLCAVIVIWEIMHFFLKGFSLQLTLTSLIPFIFLAIILSSDLSDIDYAFIVRSVAIVSIAVGCMFLLNCIINAKFDLVLAFSNMRRMGFLSDDEILRGGAINPNTLGIVNVLSATPLLLLSICKKGSKIDIFLVVLLIGLGVLTSSRTFLVCLLLMAVLLILGHSGSVIQKIKFFAYTLAVGLIVFFLIGLLFPDLLEYYIGRFMVDDITTGRDGLFVDYNKFIFGNPGVMFFGVGLNNLMGKLVNIYRASWNGPHNSVQEIISAWGIPGLLMIIVQFFVMIFESEKYGIRKNILNYTLFAIILVKCIAGQLVTSGYTILALAFAYLSMCQNFSDSDDLDETSL